ncbi:MAG: LacI family transcriptional regulator [Anaerolineales bacterium]|nr:LacI family transcriptional regulator [Anaerolineales bacterium]MDW8227681.1 LacI family DNA-binding transcriptional regulator [Anaerolineales bacterium]
MITIRDVARHAGVSITTASLVLNGKGNISEATRQRVLAAAEELNYHPNAHARHLKKRRTRTIGVFISSLGGLFYEEILEGIHNVILQTDYELIVCPETRAPSRILSNRQVDAAIVFNIHIPNELLVSLAWRRFPIVVMDRSLHSDYVYPLLVDNPGGTSAVFYHLYEQGFRRMAFVAGSPDAFDNAERQTTFLEIARQHGLEVLFAQGHFTEESGYHAARQLLSLSDLPEAVFCANDQMAIGFLKAMQEKGLKAPQDIAIVGFDDIPVARYLQPPLSTVHVSRTDWGARAAHGLINFLEQDSPFPIERIPTTFLPRQSSQPHLVSSPMP